MEFSRTHVAIAAGTGLLLVIVFLGYLNWLSKQPPILSRSEERDPLNGLPLTIKLNPLRDRTIEKTANKFIREMRDGNCKDVLSRWERDYRRKYATFICESETQHPLTTWALADREDAPPLVILHYRGNRLNTPGQDGTYEEPFSVTVENKSGQLVVTKYDAMY
jgi:hypothetical protein